jgi:hypothetical protein
LEIQLHKCFSSSLLDQTSLKPHFIRHISFVPNPSG